MSYSYSTDTAYDALDDSAYDIFNLVAYCSSLSPSVPDSEPVPNPTAPASCLKCYPKMHGHPRPSPAIVSPPVVAPASTQPPNAHNVPKLYHTIRVDEVDNWSYYTAS